MLQNLGHFLFAIASIIFVLFFFTAHAAAPVTHAYLTKVFFQRFPLYTKEDQAAFMVGTLFPDIRYLGEASRQATHISGVTLEQVLEEKDPFLAGVKFHSFVDETREAFLVKEKLYDKLRERVPFHTALFLKFAEDEVLFSEKNWSDILIALIPIYPGERKYGVSEVTLLKWHKLLTIYFISAPSYSLSLFALTGKGASELSEQEIKDWNQLLKPMSQEPLIHNWIFKMVHHFDEAYDKS